MMSLRDGLKKIKDEIVYTGPFMAFFVVTIAILLASSIFHIPGIVDHPQFDEYTDASFLKELIGSGDLAWMKSWFYMYFIIDLIWPALLLFVVYRILKFRNKKYPEQFNALWLKIAMVLIFLAYGFDYAENINYWMCFSYNNYLAYAKIGCYAAVALVLLYSCLNSVVNDFLPTILAFIKSAFFSLLILVVIGVLLPTASQVNSIVVNLYLKPLNFVILLVFLPFFAIVVAHYPSYFNFKRGRRKWYMSKINFFDLVGIISYRNKKEDNNKECDDDKGKVNKKTLNFLYRILGICFYTALFYMISYTSEVNFDWKLQMGKLTFALFLIGVFLLYFLMNIKSVWYQHHYDYFSRWMTQFYDGDYDPVSSAANEEKILFPLPNWLERRLLPKAKGQKDKINDFKVINGPVIAYLILLSLTILFHIVFCVRLFVMEYQYTETMVKLSLVAIVLQMFTFIFYRAFRSVLRFVLFNPNSRTIINAFLENPTSQEYDPQKKDAKNFVREIDGVVRFFSSFDFSKDSRFLRFFKALRWGAFSNNVLFLQVNAIFGVANLVFLIIINGQSWLATHFSTIVIILSVLFLVYGAFVVPVKNWIYHTSKQQQPPKSTTVFENLVYAVFVVLLVLGVITKNVGNDLFTLKPVPRNAEEEISLAQYERNLDESAPRYYIGCYGGGMKSNAWTMTVLNELYGSNPDMVKNTVGVSGVSGGTMGLVNFLAILNRYDKNDEVAKKERASLVKSVSTQNILSMDITHATGRDLLNYLFRPCDASGLDRSSKAMQRYAKVTGDNLDGDEARSTFRKYWKHLYQKFDRSFPIFIANTTNVQGNQGMAVSVKTERADLDSILYRGADDILQIETTDPTSGIKNHTLGFYEAASTSNRFPALSPAAKIETKGHYNDGGIFENSGLYSAYKLFQAINKAKEIKDLDRLKQKNTFVAVINDKNLYVKYYLEKELKSMKKSMFVDEVNHSSELGAILNSVASTEMTPRAIKSQLKRLANDYGCIEYEPIYLPHLFTVGDIKSLFGKKLLLKNSKMADRILHQIAVKNNRYIDSIYDAKKARRPIIEPSVSRVMAEPAYDFMKLMLLHHEVPQEVFEKLRQIQNTP